MVYVAADVILETKEILNLVSMERMKESYRMIKDRTIPLNLKEMWNGKSKRKK